MTRTSTRTSWQDLRARWQGIVDPAAAESTRDSLGWVIGLLVAGLRIGTLAQMAPSFTLAMTTSPHPAAALATWVLAVVAILVLCTGVVRTRRPPGNVLVLVDVSIAVAMFLLGGLAVAEEHRVGTWIGFQPSWALSVLMAAAVAPSWRIFLSAMAVLCAVDLWFVLPDPTDASVPTVVGNLLTLIVLPVLIRAAFRYATRIAEVADDSKARVAELARREEEGRAQAAMHNGAAVMALMARDDLSDQVKTALRSQAREETERMRRYLHGEASARGADESLAAVVEHAVAAFPDLRVDTLTDLGGHVLVSRAEAERVGAALTSVLLNVRVHAQASRVVVHLDEEDDEWTLTVHDDGVGFDVASTREGVGLREVVRAQLATDGVAVRVDSMVGAGTTVVLSAPTAGRARE